ncbi:hypothetical protein O181_018521 [Austropuccinia psidii MF-1]|uniref:Uncharacterized protein n=1 Tax=Austropuccinia psidii MF-1 TaxID=1389203 RepID=A0A9Q3C9S5_9BASI|nr:hypothetical protein [Austropuccinia psidii MF-1]
MNVSGLKIDVGNATSQNSSSWSIPNISVTPIPLNPTNTQMCVSEGPATTPEITPMANPQSKYPRDLLLNPGWIPVESQEPFGETKEPSCNISSGSQAQVGHENPVDRGRQKITLENVPLSGLSKGNPGLPLNQNMAPKGKTVQFQEPIEDREYDQYLSII